MRKPPKVLLLGDSNRLLYQPPVVEKLKGKADVVGPEENGQFSLYTLASLKRWLQQLGTPDVVHWNNGLHDCGHNPKRSPVQIPIDMYTANLGFILEQLQDAKARVVWAASTPVHLERHPFSEKEWSWRDAEIREYNNAAEELMRSHDVPVNDLYAVVAPDLDRFLTGDGIHLSEAGQDACAQAAADIIVTQFGR